MSTHLTPSDRTFMKHFAIMIAMLASTAVVLIIIGTFVWASLPKESNQREEQRAGDRITPVAAVYAGDTGRAAMEAAKVAADKAAASQVAYGGTTDGKTIFGHLCTTCHSTGAVTRVMIETTDKDGTVWSTVGVSTNVIDASYNALHDSLTYKLWRTGRRD